MKKILVLLAILIALPWTVRAQDTTIVGRLVWNENDTYDTIAPNDNPPPLRVFHIDTVGWVYDTVLIPIDTRRKDNLSYAAETWEDYCLFNKIAGFYRTDSIPILDTTEANHGTYYVPRER